MTVDGRFERIEIQMATLQRQMGMLQNELSGLLSHEIRSQAKVANVNQTHIFRTSNQGGRHGPNFVGRTRPAFSFDVARSSLKNIGIHTDASERSGAATPERDDRRTILRDFDHAELLGSLSKDKMLRLINVYEEEVHPVYPFVNMSAITSAVDTLSGKPRSGFTAGPNEGAKVDGEQNMTDTMLVRVVVAIGNVVESLGANEFSSKLVESVEADLTSLVNANATYTSVAVLTILVKCIQDT